MLVTIAGAEPVDQTGSALPGGKMHFTEAQKNLLVGLFFALLSLLFIFVVNKYGIEQPTANYQAGSAAIAPNFFPNMICWLTFAFSLGLTIESFMGMRRDARTAKLSEAPGEVKQEKKDPEEKKSGTIAFISRITGMGIMFLMYYVTDYLGIIISGFFFYLLYAGLTGEQRPLRAVLGAAITTMTLYYFFVKIAVVPMPLGLLSDIL